MQTPSQGVGLDLYSPIKDDEDKASTPGQSVQKIIRFDLKEEGNHVLAANVSYTENTLSAGMGSSITGSRNRAFRKLYQFVAKPCLNVRTKATELPSPEVEDRLLEPSGRSKLLRFALEAQLENMADTPITLEQTSLDTCDPFKSTSVNWDLPEVDGALLDRPILNPSDVLQIAYVVEQQQHVKDGVDTLHENLKRDGRTPLGQMSIRWRGEMGEPGVLKTGNLLTRRIAS